MKYFLIPLVYVSLLVGCHLSVRPSEPTEQLMIQTAAERDVLAIFLSLYQRNDIETASVISTDCISEMTEFVFPLLTKQDTRIVRASEQMLFSKLTKIDEKYQVSMSRSIDILHSFYIPPASDRGLDEKSKENLMAFFRGIEAGCREGR